MRSNPAYFQCRRGNADIHNQQNLLTLTNLFPFPYSLITTYPLIDLLTYPLHFPLILTFRKVILKNLIFVLLLHYKNRLSLLKKGKNMISVNDFKTGLTVELDNGLWTVVEFLHVKPGKGAAFVRSKLKNVITGQVVEKTFRAGEKVAKATLDRREMQYLYKEGTAYVMMDNETYDQIHVEEAQIGSGIKYLKENMNVMVLTHEGKIIGVDIPAHVELEVVDTPPSEKGNTSQGGTKPATLETGAVVNVPFFVANGDVIRVDTRTNEYLDRV